MIDRNLIACARVLPDLLANVRGTSRYIPEFALERELLLHRVHRAVNEAHDDENNDEDKKRKDNVPKHLERRDEE